MGRFWSRTVGFGAVATVLVASTFALNGLSGAGAATPDSGTVSLDDRTLHWQGEHYPVGSTVFAGTTCPAAPEEVCDRFDLNVDVAAAHWETHRGGVEVRITWPSAEDDFDLHVFDADGNRVASSIAANTTSERVFVEDASGDYSVRVNPYAVTDSDYEGEVTLHSRKRLPRDAGAPEEPVFDQRCAGGRAAGFPCRGVDLAAFLPHDTIGGGEGNDIWGWTDPETGREYALVGKTVGTAFVDVTDPTAPTYLGLLPSHQPVETFFSSWRDVKVYRNHAYVVSEEPTHGMQVFDLTRLRGVSEERTWTEDAHYPLFGGAHNVAIDEESGFAYAVGSNTCAGGPHAVDIRQPKTPTFAGCVAEDGYTHDTQCVVYRGPDADHQGREVCLSSNEDTLTIVDVTDKLFPRQLSRTTYPNATYTHQGWLTEDQRHFLLGDELDEVEAGVPTTTYVFDVSDLDAPVLAGVHEASTPAIDHNLYVRGDKAYQANYRAGLRILDLRRVADARLREVAFFDIYPPDDAAEFNAAWSSYPYFDSGTVVVSGIEQGLFVLRPD
jgi:choice-of-anchor B domain-containing protein